MKPFRGDKTLGLAIRQVFAAVERESKFEACSRLAFRMHDEVPSLVFAGKTCRRGLLGNRQKSGKRARSTHDLLVSNVENLQHDPS